MGIAIGLYPKYALALCLLGLVFALAFRFPVAHLLTLLFVSALVPLTIQSKFGSGGGAAAAGVLPTDVFVLAGLARAAVKLPHVPLDRRATRVLVLSAVLAALVFGQLIQARLLGRFSSGVGAEGRVLLGLSTTLIALPIVTDRAGRMRLLRGLAVFGVLLGLWGIAQFALQLRFDVPANMGGGSTETFNTAGRVVGMYAFPVAALVALSVLTSGAVRRADVRLALAGIIALNLGAMALTFERTFFVAFGAGLLILMLRARGRQRIRVAAWAPGLFLATALALAALAPAAFDATSQRLTSVKNYKTDPSVVYRQYESRLVTNRIKAHPLTGSGLGADILIGRPGTNQPIKPRRYAENGYLWLVWKLGVLGAVVLIALLAAAIMCRPPSRDPLERAVIAGAQASLFALAVATVAFPSWNQLAITPTIGLLLAFAVSRVPPRMSSLPGRTA
jgi:hypothetical protein